MNEMAYAMVDGILVSSLFGIPMHYFISQPVALLTKTVQPDTAKMCIARKH